MRHNNVRSHQVAEAHEDCGNSTLSAKERAGFRAFFEKRGMHYAAKSEGSFGRKRLGKGTR